MGGKKVGMKGRLRNRLSRLNFNFKYFKSESLTIYLKI